MQRIIISTWQGSEVSDPEEREAIEDQIKSAHFSRYIRRSYSRDKAGELSADAWIVKKGELWYLYYGDVSGCEIIEFTSAQEADSAYETQVRELANSADGVSQWWDVTDVPGVPVSD
jgi:hypothetical protein